MGGCRLTGDREGISRVPAVRLDFGGEDPDTCAVVREETLTISVEAVGSYTLMWTPTLSRIEAMGFTGVDGLLGDGELSEAMALAVGFLFTEGVIGGLADLSSIAFCPSAKSSSAVGCGGLAGTTIPRRRPIPPNRWFCRPMTILISFMSGEKLTSPFNWLF